MMMAGSKCLVFILSAILDRVIMAIIKADCSESLRRLT